MTAQQLQFIDRVRKHWFIRQLFTADVLDFIACQFALESNFGTSRLSLLNNNYCGMKLPYRRVTYAHPSKLDFEEFAYYVDFDNCLFDYYAWFMSHNPHANTVSDLSAFKIFLQNSGYCPEKGYIDKINLIYQQLKNYKNE